MTTKSSHWCASLALLAVTPVPPLAYEQRVRELVYLSWRSSFAAAPLGSTRHSLAAQCLWQRAGQQVQKQLRPIIG